MKKVIEKIKHWFVGLGKKLKAVRWNKVFQKARNASLALAGVFLSVASVIFIFATDLFATNTAVWLMIGAILGFGAAFVSMLSEINKENKILVYSLKGGALLLMVGFVVFLAFFANSTVVTSLDETDKYISMFSKNGISCVNAINVTMVITYVITSLGIATQIFNITSNAVLGIEE